MKMKNRKWICLYGLLCLVMPLFAQQYMVRGGDGEPMLAADETSYKLKVYVVNGVEDITLSYTSSSTSHHWKKYRTRALEAEDIPCQQEGTTSTLTNVEEGCGYFVYEEGALTYYVWIIDYAKHPFVINTLSVSDSNDPCSCALLKGDREIENLTYYLPTGIPKSLEREFQVTYNSLEWDEESKTLNPIIQTQTLHRPFEELVGPIYTDTDITLSGDQFAEHFGLTQQATLDYYEASQLFLEADTMVIAEEADNMSAQGEGLSAPVTVRFTAYANEPTAAYYVWSIYREEDGPDNPLVRLSEPEVEYTFNEFGKFKAVVEVSNASGSCYTSSEEFELDVAESFLDVPNAFSPGTTPGVNDEFRVAYKSLVRFSCWIFNRWGQEIYHWTNPATGWDGKKNGKYVAPGVYFYVIEAEGSDGKRYKRKGDINILRPKNEKNFESNGSTDTEGGVL